MDTPSSLPFSPLLGHVPSLVRRPLEFVRAVRSYGSVVKVYIGIKPAYFVNDPELIRHGCRSPPL